MLLLSSNDVFFKIKILSECLTVCNFVGPDLGPNYFLRLSTDENVITSMKRVNNVNWDASLGKVANQQTVQTSMHKIQ